MDNDSVFSAALAREVASYINKQARSLGDHLPYWELVGPAESLNHAEINLRLMQWCSCFLHRTPRCWLRWSLLKYRIPKLCSVRRC